MISIVKNSTLDERIGPIACTSFSTVLPLRSVWNIFCQSFIFNRWGIENKTSFPKTSEDVICLTLGICTWLLHFYDYIMAKCLYKNSKTSHHNFVFHVSISIHYLYFVGFWFSSRYICYIWDTFKSSSLAKVNF